jgi:hypothetical protein
MYEHTSHKLLARPAFLRRAARHVAVAWLVIAVVDGFGTAGYRFFAGIPWIDAFLNASMILGGMGPVDRMETGGAKVFAALYALFSGLLFIAIMGVMIAPWVHRMIHKMHAEED